jgi:hypothetical protein
VDCGLWDKHRGTKTADIYEAFLVGTLNGLSMGSAVEFWQSAQPPISAEQAFLWMDNYCRQNPLNDIVVGAIKLMNERTRGAYSRSHGD